MMLRALLLLAPLSSLAFQLHCGISSNLPRNGQLTQLTSARLGPISGQYRSRKAFRTTPRMVDTSVEESKQFWLELVNQKMAQKEEERKAAAAKDTEIIQPAGDCYNAEEAKLIVSNARAKLDAQFQEIDARTQRTLRRVLSHADLILAVWNLVVAINWPTRTDGMLRARRATGAGRIPASQGGSAPLRRDGRLWPRRLRPRHARRNIRRALRRRAGIPHSPSPPPARDARTNARAAIKAAPARTVSQGQTTQHGQPSPPASGEGKEAGRTNLRARGSGKN
jgi:hypothetical protein